MRPNTSPNRRMPRERLDVRGPRTDLIALLLMGQTEKTYRQSSILHPAGEMPGGLLILLGVGSWRNVTGGLRAPRGIRVPRASGPRGRTLHGYRGDRSRWSSGR